MISHKELLSILSYDFLTGILCWKVSHNTKIKVGDIAGTKRKDGYVHIQIKGNKYLAHRLAYFHYHGYMPEGQVDHFPDRTKHHNWISNLREASPQCQTRNQGNRKDNTSGIKGVAWYKQTNRWMSFLKINNKRHHIGYFKDFDEAVCARLAVEQCVGWEDCDSHSSAFKYVQKMLG